MWLGKPLPPPARDAQRYCEGLCAPTQSPVPPAASLIPASSQFAIFQCWGVHRAPSHPSPPSVFSGTAPLTVMKQKPLHCLPPGHPGSLGRGGGVLSVEGGLGFQ